MDYMCGFFDELQKLGSAVIGKVCEESKVDKPKKLEKNISVFKELGKILNAIALDHDLSSRKETLRRVLWEFVHDKWSIVWFLGPLSSTLTTQKYHNHLLRLGQLIKVTALDPTLDLTEYSASGDDNCNLLRYILEVLIQNTEEGMKPSDDGNDEEKSNDDGKDDEDRPELASILASGIMKKITEMQELQKQFVKEKTSYKNIDKETKDDLEKAWNRKKKEAQIFIDDIDNADHKGYYRLLHTTAQKMFKKYNAAVKDLLESSYGKGSPKSVAEDYCLRASGYLRDSSLQLRLTTMSMDPTDQNEGAQSIVVNFLKVFKLNRQNINKSEGKYDCTEMLATDWSDLLRTAKMSLKQADQFRVDHYIDCWEKFKTIIQDYNQEWSQVKAEILDLSLAQETITFEVEGEELKWGLKHLDNTMEESQFQPNAQPGSEPVLECHIFSKSPKSLNPMHLANKLVNLINTWGDTVAATASDKERLEKKLEEIKKRSLSAITNTVLRYKRISRERVSSGAAEGEEGEGEEEGGGGGGLESARDKLYKQNHMNDFLHCWRQVVKPIFYNSYSPYLHEILQLPRLVYTVNDNFMPKKKQKTESAEGGSETKDESGMKREIAFKILASATSGANLTIYVVDDKGEKVKFSKRRNAVETEENLVFKIPFVYKQKQTYYNPFGTWTLKIPQEHTCYVRLDGEAEFKKIGETLSVDDRKMEETKRLIKCAGEQSLQRMQYHNPENLLIPLKERCKGTIYMDETGCSRPTIFYITAKQPLRPPRPPRPRSRRRSKSERS